MGLDMYLKGKRYLSSYFNEGDNEKAAKIAELGGRSGRMDNSIVKEIMIEAGYWRKANAIHKWFIDNCQEGEDNCQAYYVGREQLEELRELCQKVLADRAKAAELLPPAEWLFLRQYRHRRILLPRPGADHQDHRRRTDPARFVGIRVPKLVVKIQQ